MSPKGTATAKKFMESCKTYFFHFFAVSSCELLSCLLEEWQLKFQQDYVIGASMILVAIYFICRESLAFELAG